MELTTRMLIEQRDMAQKIKDKLETVEDTEKREPAIIYCDGCILACDLALDVINRESQTVQTSKEPDEKPVEEKPKKRSHHKKAKEEPKEEPAITPETETVDLGESSSAPAPETEDDLGDLDDLF